MNNLFMGRVFALRFDVRSNRVKHNFSFAISDLLWWDWCWADVGKLWTLLIPGGVGCSLQYTELLISTSLCIIEQANIPPLFSILYVPRLLKQPILQILLKLDLCKYKLFLCNGGSNLFQSCQTDKLMAGTKFSDYLGLKHYKK